MVFYGVSSYLLLLYKQLPNKVKLLSLILNVYFIGFQLFSEGKLYSSASLIFSNIALHIETTSLADRTYELIHEPDEDTSEVKVNITKNNEDLNVNLESKNELHEVQPTSRN